MKVETKTPIQAQKSKVAEEKQAERFKGADKESKKAKDELNGVKEQGNGVNIMA